MDFVGNLFEDSPFMVAMDKLQVGRSLAVATVHILAAAGHIMAVDRTKAAIGHTQVIIRNQVVEHKHLVIALSRSSLIKLHQLHMLMVFSIIVHIIKDIVIATFMHTVKDILLTLADHKLATIVGIPEEQRHRLVVIVLDRQQLAASHSQGKLAAVVLRTAVVVGYSLGVAVGRKLVAGLRQVVGHRMLAVADQVELHILMASTMEVVIKEVELDLHILTQQPLLGLKLVEDNLQVGHLLEDLLIELIHHNP